MAINHEKAAKNGRLISDRTKTNKFLLTESELVAFALAYTSLTRSVQMSIEQAKNQPLSNDLTGQEMPRREMLRLASLGLAGLLVGVTGCSDHKDGAPVLHPSDHTLFNGDVKVKCVETTQHYSFGDDIIESISFTINATKPGTYLFEGWVENYRDHDSPGDKWNFTVTNAPVEKTFDANSLIYRLEATRVCEAGKIERDTTYFKYEGIAGGFAIAGQPTTP